MCDLFSLIPTLEVDETLQPLCDTALTFLWNCAASAVSVLDNAVLRFVILIINYIGWLCRGSLLQYTLPF